MHSKIGGISVNRATLASIAAAVALLLLSGCFEMNEEIYINPDGSAVLVQDLIMDSMMAGMMALNPEEDPFAEVKEKAEQDPAPLTDGIITDLAFEKLDEDGKTRFRHVIQISDVWKLLESEKALQWIGEIGGGEEPSPKPAPFSLARGEKRAVLFTKTLDMTSVPMPGRGEGMGVGFPGGPGDPGFAEPPVFPPIEDAPAGGAAWEGGAGARKPKIEYASLAESQMQAEETPPEGSEPQPDEVGGEGSEAPPDEFGGMPDPGGMDSPFGDSAEFGEEMGRKMAAQMFAGKYYTIRLHVPKLVSCSGERKDSAKAGDKAKDTKKEASGIPAGVKMRKFETAEWKIELTELMADEGFAKELTAEFKLNGGPAIPRLAFPVAGLVVLMIAVIAGTRKRRNLAPSAAQAAAGVVMASDSAGAAESGKGGEAQPPEG